MFSAIHKEKKVQRELAVMVKKKHKKYITQYGCIYKREHTNGKHEYWRVPPTGETFKTIFNKRLKDCTNQTAWHGHVKKVEDHRLPKIVLEWIPTKNKKRTAQENMDRTNKRSNE